MSSQDLVLNERTQLPVRMWLCRTNSISTLKDETVVRPSKQAVRSRESTVRVEFEHVGGGIKGVAFHSHRAMCIRSNVGRARRGDTLLECAILH
jgi:hypothetical protein